MNTPREWISVAEAAALVGRTPSTIYRWIDQELLAMRLNATANNRIEVLSKGVARLAPARKRGRPRQ